MCSHISWAHGCKRTRQESKGWPPGLNETCQKGGGTCLGEDGSGEEWGKKDVGGVKEKCKYGNGGGLGSGQNPGKQKEKTQPNSPVSDDGNKKVRVLGGCVAGKWGLMGEEMEGNKGKTAQGFVITHPAIS